MPARVVHFGPDDCHRLMVLRSAGYTVEDCASLLQLRAALKDGDTPDAVLLSDGYGIASQEAVSVAHAHSSNPVILFRSTNAAYEDCRFDLIIPCLTPPEVWLSDMDALIEKKRTRLRA